MSSTKNRLGKKLKRFYNTQQMLKQRTHKLGLKKPFYFQKGFTLVELMVTIVVLGIVISSLGGLYYIMQVVEVQSQHLDIATRAARTEIETLRNNGYSSLTPGSTVDFTASLPASLPKNKNGKVTISQPLSELRRVDVTITYTDYGKPQTITLSSNIGIIGIGRGQ